MLVYRSPRYTTKMVAENVHKIGIFLCVRGGKNFPPKRMKKHSGFNDTQNDSKYILL